MEELENKFESRARKKLKEIHLELKKLVDENEELTNIQRQRLMSLMIQRRLLKSLLKR